MSDIMLQLVWVAAHHGLRADGAKPVALRRFGYSNMWPLVHDITAVLGFPPAPGPHEVTR